MLAGGAVCGEMDHGRVFLSEAFLRAAGYVPVALTGEDYIEPCR